MTTSYEKDDTSMAIDGLETVALDDALPSNNPDSGLVNQGFPIRVDPRFHYVKRLGRGGSGLVYQAYDDVLQRHVALKFLIRQAQDNLPTLVAEARAQANVDHPFICPIYEVLESDNSVYLVMQFIDGQTLHDISASLTVEQHLLLLAKTAQALHSAHALGIVHRDFKPLNVMIKTDEQGLTPVLVDFGLAGFVNSQTINAAGATPRFAAPEQLYKNNRSLKESKTVTASHTEKYPATGSRQSYRIDRRVDVYALGATLYYCLTGQLPPIAQKQNERPNNTAEWLALPLDVRLIIQRCMAFHPSDRYNTAGLVAADIQRYLEGEPISTRKSVVYRVGKKLVKHKWLTLAFSLVFVVSSGAFVNQRFEALRQVKREQTLLTFNDQIKALEYEVLLTLSAPRHNITAKRTQWVRQVAAIVDRLPQMDRFLQGSAHYAIGRSYLVVNDLPKALTHLKQAHQLESRPKVSFYLAMAYSGMYRRTVDRLRTIENDTVRKARLADAQQRFRQPAIALLQANLPVAEFPSYANALLAYLQDDWETVLRLLEDANDLPSWFYRDELLKGDIALAQASAKHEAGQSLADVLPLITLAEQNYKAAAQIAPSDPWVATKPYMTALFDLRAHIQAGEAWQSDALTRLRDDYASLLTIDTSNSQIHATYGQLAHFYGLNLQYTNGDSAPWFALAEKQLKVANNLANDDEKYWMALGRLYSSIVNYRRQSSLDYAQELQQAIHALEQVPEQQRDYYYFNEMGTLNRVRAIEMQERGEDAQRLFNKAIEYYVAANRLFPEHIGSLINAASTLQLSSGFDDYAKRDAALSRAKTLVNKALESDNQHFVANYYLAMFEVESVRLALYNDYDATHALDIASMQMSKLESINAVHPYALDLGLRLQRYHAENEFNQTVQWQPAFMDIVANRRALHQQFASNTTVMANYIGATTTTIAIRLHLGMDISDLINVTLADIQEFPQFDNVNAYQALLQVFANWRDPDFSSEYLVDDFNLRGNSSHAAEWAKAVIQAHSGTTRHQLSVAEKQVMDNTGLLPVYKKQLVAWIRQKATQLADNKTAK